MYAAWLEETSERRWLEKTAELTRISAYPYTLPSRGGTKLSKPGG